MLLWLLAYELLLGRRRSRRPNKSIRVLDRLNNAVIVSSFQALGQMGSSMSDNDIYLSREKLSPRVSRPLELKSLNPWLNQQMWTRDERVEGGNTSASGTLAQPVV